LSFFAWAGAATSVILTVGLATGRVGGGGVAALGVAAFLLVAAWCFAHKRVDQTLLALALYLGLLDGYVKLSTGSDKITLARDALVVAIAAGALLRSAQTTRRTALPPLAGFVFTFVAVVMIELANPSARGGLTTSLAGARQHLEFVPLFFLGYAFVRTESQIRKALFVFVLCAAAGGVVSYLQSKLSPDQLATWGPGYADRIHGTGAFAGAARLSFAGGVNSVRPFGLGSEVGSGAIVAALALPGMIALLLAGRPRVRWAIALLSVGVGLAVATSGSRGALITVFASLVAFGLLAAASKNVAKAVAGIAVAVALIFGAFVQLGPDNASTQRAQSITPGRALSTFSNDRGGSVKLFGSLVTAYPFGAGLATAGPAAGFQREAGALELNAETQWNFLVIEAGIAGVVVYVALLLRLMWLALTRIRLVADPVLRLYLAALAAPIFAMLVAGFSGPTTASVPSAPFFWLVSGVLAYWLVTAHRSIVVSGSRAAP
jgi:hypothetical protein